MMSERITQAVKSKYGSVATSGLSSNLDGVKAVAEAFGYTPEELVKKRGDIHKEKRNIQVSSRTPWAPS